MVYEALNHLLHPALTGHVQWGRELPAILPWPGGAVDVSTIANEEAGSGCVFQQDGTVEESQCGAV